MQVNIRYDVTRTTRRGININIDGSMGRCWIMMKYERLPDFCYHCGTIVNLVEDCGSTCEGMERKNVIRHRTALGSIFRGTTAESRDSLSHNRNSSADWAWTKYGGSVGEVGEKGRAVEVIREQNGAEASGKRLEKKTILGSNLAVENNSPILFPSLEDRMGNLSQILWGVWK